MFKHLFFYLLILVFQNVVVAQNLIPDSSFENYYTKPINFSCINHSKSWYAPTHGTTNYFCINKDKAVKEINVPENEFGYQKPLQGSCYAGFIAYGAGRDYREYLQTKLTSSLEIGQTYCLNFNFSLADYSMWQVNKLGILFSENEIKNTKTKTVKNKNIVYFLMDSISKFDTINWIPACYYFTATESSKYFTIGGFEVDNPLFRKIKFDPAIKNKPKNFAYYYIDNVSLHQVNDSNLCSCAINGRRTLKSQKKDTAIIEKYFLTKENKTIILKNILFEVDDYSLLSQSYNELDRLVIYLKENKNKCIEIAGHTDNSGNEAHNQNLAETRVKAVVNYLIEKSIEKERITYTSFGSKKPLFENDTEEHKSANRRVEITFK